MADDLMSLLSPMMGVQGTRFQTIDAGTRPETRSEEEILINGVINALTAQGVPVELAAKLAVDSLASAAIQGQTRVQQQTLKNQGFANVQEMKGQQQMGIEGMKQSGATERANIRASSEKEIEMIRERARRDAMSLQRELASMKSLEQVNQTILSSTAKFAMGQNGLAPTEEMVDEYRESLIRFASILPEPIAISPTETEKVDFPKMKQDARMAKAKGVSNEAILRAAATKYALSVEEVEQLRAILEE